MTREYAIYIKSLSHLYDTPSRRFLVAVDELSIPMGSLTTLLGPSGCGKSTVLSRMGLLLALGKYEHSSVETFKLSERVTAGGTVVHDVAHLLDLGKFGHLKIETLRRKLMGFFLQSGELIPTLTIKENVAMPLRLNGVSAREANERAEGLLGYLLDVSVRSIPNKLALDCSGGEYQRIALARAIAHRPQILFVDEPTSSLDTPNKHRVLDLMMKLVRDEETTVVMINHDETLARMYSDFIVNFEASPVGWGDQIPIEFRACDGFGQPKSFEANINDLWIATKSDFHIDLTFTKGEQHVA
jgi:putative ABC transport system ATP-binding protein